MSEALLQARLVETVRKALPMLPATLQVERYLSLRLGHHAITIDGAPAGPDVLVRGRLDLLVLHRDRPLLLFELKAPDIPLGDADVAQALSYARAMVKMPPLVVVTNGNQVRIASTYDGAQLNEAALGDLERTLAAAAALAASDANDSIRALLGRDARLWAAIFSDWNGRTRRGATGPARAISNPLCDGFQIPREATREVCTLVEQGAHVVAVTGPPLAGLTNVLAELESAPPNDAAILWLGPSPARSPLQHIANRLTRELSLAISSDDVRRWLQTAYAETESARLVLALDGAPENLEEIVDLTAQTRVSLVLALGENLYARLARRDGREEATVFGAAAKVVRLLPLSDAELAAAIELLAATHRVVFYPGVQYSPELRLPRMLRTLLAVVPAQRQSSPTEETLSVMAPLTDPRRLRLASKTWAQLPEVANDLRRLAEAYFADADEQADNPAWLTRTYGMPSVDFGEAERLLGEGRLQRLSDQGFISLLDDPVLGARALVRVEEVFAFAIGTVLARTAAKERLAAEAFANRVTKHVSALPAGAATGALSILLRGQDDEQFLVAVLRCLVDDHPTVEIAGEGRRLALLTSDGPINLVFGEGMREQLVGNLIPWIVLSFLLGEELGAAEGGLSRNLGLFIQVGRAPLFLQHVEPAKLEHVRPYPLHTIEGLGDVLCTHAGLVEPITQAMVAHAHRAHTEFGLLAKYAVEHDEFFLASRVHTAARLVSSAADEEVAATAAQVEARVTDYLNLHFREGDIHAEPEKWRAEKAD